MEANAYRAFTQELLDRLDADPEVVGLVAVGSMADQDYPPDRWSDHDFFVVTVSGVQERYRSDMSWLPRTERIAFWFRETAHGLKVVYDDGHLLEFAVFDLEELDVARVNRYRVLLDRERVEQRVAELAARTQGEAARHRPGDDYLLGMFLANLMVGAGRYRRGERLSGQRFVKSHALGHLLTLLTRHLPAERRDLLDNLDPTRRFELAYPTLGAALDAMANLPPPQAAAGMIDLAEQALLDTMPQFPAGSMALARRYVLATMDGDS